MTVAEYSALPEDSDHRYELEEGMLVMSPRPIPDHQYCLGELQFQLRGQLAEGLVSLAEVDIDLELVGPHDPGFVRVPDLVIVTREALERVRRGGGRVSLTACHLAGEFGYADAAAATGTFAADTPFSVHLDLDALV